MKIEVTREIAEALDELTEICGGFEYEMYCVMNKYLFNQASAYQNPKLEPLRRCNPFDVVDAIRYGYVVKKEMKVSNLTWKDVFNCERMLGATFNQCMLLANEMGYKYLSFNDVIFEIDGFDYRAIGRNSDLD